jgi:hypothetical protein
VRRRVVPPRPSFRFADLALLAFAKAWVKWSRTPKTNDRPKDIDNEMLFCRHQRLLVDLDSEAETPDLISTVTEKEWKMLKDS